MEWPFIQGFTEDKRFAKWIDGCLDGWLVSKLHEISRHMTKHAVSGTYQLSDQYSPHFLCFIFLLYWQINYLRMIPLSHLIISWDWAQEKRKIGKKWCSIFNRRESFSIYNCLTHHFAHPCLKRTLQNQ